MAASDYADACPVCDPGDPPASPPVGYPRRVRGGLITAHQCAVCEAAWETFWREGWPIDRLIAPVSPEQAEQNRKALDKAMKESGMTRIDMTTREWHEL